MQELFHNKNTVKTRLLSFTRGKLTEVSLTWGTGLILVNLPYGKIKAHCLCCAFTSGYTSILPVLWGNRKHQYKDSLGEASSLSSPILRHNKAVLVSAGIFTAGLRICVNYPSAKATFFACKDSLSETGLQLRQRAGKPLRGDCC